MQRTLDQPAAATIVPPIAITDGELLMRFSRHGDEQAFAALVEKHGRLVWTVCWQVLREHHAIEDAFQSTFFILAKRAGSIRSCDSLCGWLYRVAYRTALRARMSVKAKPISALGSEADTMEEWSELDDKLRAIEQDEQRAALLEELQALPEKYQQALALCYLEGKTRRAIADELGCSLETVKGRLARGRQVLRHRLIRRGVSLALAMAAMTIPVKSATAAVTPSLIGLTVTGATAWAAGTLGTAKIAGGAGTAKAVSTTSAQVIHLAHQGTVAMTIASFAKPAVIAVALLGAVSGTLAVDSSDSAQSGGEVQAINLAAGAEGDAIESEDIAAEGETPVVTVAAVEDASSDDNREAKKDAAFAFEFAEGPKAQLIRQGKSVTISAPAPSAYRPMPAMPPVPVTAPVEVRVPKLDLNLQLKLAHLESRVSQLQLESKEIEIAAFEAEGKQREELLEASRRKLIEAEAEKLKIQIEQQQEQIKALEKALNQQAEELGKQAAKMAVEAGQIAIQAEKAASAEAAKAAVQAKDAVKQAATLKVQGGVLQVNPGSGATISAGTSGAWIQPGNDQEGALSLQPGDRIHIEAIGSFPDKPIEGVYVIEPMGTVALGATYGRVEIVGLPVIEAEKEILEHLKTILSDVQVQVTFEGRPQPRVLYAPAATDPAPSSSALEHETEPSKAKKYE